MGINLPHALGRNQKFFVTPEVSFGTLVQPSTTDAMKVLASSFEFAQERVDRPDSRQTRSSLERITRRKSVSWSLTSFLLPSGAAGTAPDIGPLLKACMGEEVVVGGVSVAYNLLAGQTDLTSVGLTREMNGVIMEHIKGCWVESYTINVSGTDEPKITFEGGAADSVGTGPATATPAVDGSGTPVGTIIVGTDEATNFDVGSRIKVGGDDNGGAGFVVTAVDTGADSIDITPDLTTDQTSDTSIIPFAPVETTAGSPISLITGSLDIDGTSVPITSLEITCKNNVKPLDDEAFSTEAVTDFIPGFREVSGNMNVRLRKDATILHNRRKLFSSNDIQIVIGSGAGKILTVDMNFAEFDFSGVEVPEAEEATFTLPFKALGSVGEDELTLTWT